jgi:hypothetical protein
MLIKSINNKGFQMRKTFLFVIAIIIPVLLHAQEPYFMAKAGDQALLFSLKGLSIITAGDFDGGLGYQTYFANHWAFRFGLGFGYDKKTVAKPAGTLSDSVSARFRLDFMPAIRYNISESANMEAYIGLAALVSLSNNTVDGAGFYDINFSEKETGLGACLIVGAEWFAFKNLSLSAEYQLMLKTTSGKKKVTSGTNEQEDDMPISFNLMLGASQANFTISFYFD